MSALLHAALLVSVISASMLSASAVHAQARYQWKDASGTMVYSDLPPPAGVTALSVVQVPAAAAASSVSATPGSQPPGSHTAVAPSSNGSVAGSSGNAGLNAGLDGNTMADQETAFQKRRLERQQAEAKQAKQNDDAARHAAACADARERLRVLQGGGRIATVTADGERGFLSDEQIAERTNGAQQVVNEVCR